MKKKIIILSSLFIFFVLVMAPVKLIENYLPQQNDIVLSGFNGSVWSGEVSQAITPLIKFNDISFSISPIALLMAKLSVDLDIPKGDIKGKLNVRFGSNYQNNIELSDANLMIQTTSFQSLIPINNTSIEGVIKTNDLNAKFKNKKPSYLQGVINWENAGVSYAGENWSLGNFNVELSTDDKNVIHGKLLKGNNKLSLEGSFTLTDNGLLEIIGSIATDIDQRVYQSFALFNNGKPANGRLPIKFKQKLF